MRHPAYLEIGPSGHTLAFVFALPGLSLRARRADEALAALALAVAAELARLRAAGRPVAVASESIEITEAERVTVTSDVEGERYSPLRMFSTAWRTRARSCWRRSAGWHPGPA